MARRFGSHNRSWIWGRHVVLETLRAGKWRPLELLVSPRCTEQARHELDRLARLRQVEFTVVTDDQLARRCRSDEHQGLAASLPPFPYARFDELLSSTPLLSTWLVLDRMHDSFNFGAVLRAAEGLGVKAVVIGSEEQSEVNSQVVRSSAGAVNYVPIAKVDRLADAVQALRDAGCAVVAASEKAAHPLPRVDLRGPVAVVIGNEGQGIQPAVWRLCTTVARIPMTGRIGSLNAAVAAGIVCYEIVRQRSTPNSTPPGSAAHSADDQSTR
jgi:23S rRNA (guanosine2251-2'-O)-methyltransferase